jgi:hypothetical protein
MSQLSIFVNYWLHRMGISREGPRAHAAHRWLLHPTFTGNEKTEMSAWERLITRGRPEKRFWTYGMTSLQDQAYCEWYGRELYRGRGKAVELGCWFGSLSISLIRGLAANKSISLTKDDYHVYDLFEWHPCFDDAVKGLELEGQFKEVWIHVAMFLLRDYYKPLYEVPGGATYVFQCLRQPDQAALAFPDSIKDCPEDLITETYEWALGLMSNKQIDRMSAAHIMVYYHRGDYEKVRSLFRKYYTNGPYKKSWEFGMLIDYLKSLGFDFEDDSVVGNENRNM